MNSIGDGVAWNATKANSGTKERPQSMTEEKMDTASQSQPCGEVASQYSVPEAGGSGVVAYRGWWISYDPPPIPVRSCDWQFWHDDYDGAPTHSEDGFSADNRCGSAPSLEAAKAEIDAWEDDL